MGPNWLGPVGPFFLPPIDFLPKYKADAVRRVQEGACGWLLMLGGNTEVNYYDE